MLDTLLLAAIPLLPFAAAAVLALDMAALQRLSERAVRRIAGSAVALSFLLSAWILAGQARHPAAILVHFGRWLYSGDYRVDIDLLIDPLSATMMVLTTGFGALVSRFSQGYMHRERGFRRFYAVLSLFIASMLLLVMGGNLVLTFAGWEGVGLCSYLLIGFYYEREAPASAGTRAFITNRIGDVGFLAAIFLTFTRLGAIDYRSMAAGAGALDGHAATIIALCLLVAVAAKSAQLPLSPWLARAMEGPTPSSALFYAAVMVNAGVYLVVRARPLFEAAPGALAAMAAVGAATALYGGLVGAVQTDVKGALIFSTQAQLGLMFLTIGLGDATIAVAHMVAHAIFRGFQFLAAPSVLLRQRPGSAPPPPPAQAWFAPFVVGGIALVLGLAPLARPGSSLHGFLAVAAGEPAGRPLLPQLPASGALGLLLLAAWSASAYGRRAAAGRAAVPAPDRGRLYAAALHRLWLEDLHERIAVRPVLRLGRWLDRLDVQALERLIGHLVAWIAGAVHTVEEHVVARGVGRGIPATGRALGRTLDRLDGVLDQPLVACALIVVCLAAVLQGAL